MATRGGRVRISIEGDSSDLTRSVDAANRSLTNLKKGESVGTRALRGIGTAAKWGAAGVGALAVVELPRMVDEAQEAAKATAQTEAVLKSTGGAANVTADDVAKLANQLSLKTAIDDEQIQSSENMLLTFTNIRNEVGRGNDIFDQATQTVVDMSVAMGTDMKSASIQLGKALNDPIAGMSSLSRVGVQLDEQTKAQITSLVEQGDTMKAQKLILAELTKEFGGSAAAQATTADKLKVAWANVEEELGTALMPTLNDAARAIIKFIDEWHKGVGVGGTVRDVFMAVGAAIRWTVQAVKVAGDAAIPALVTSFWAVVNASKATANWVAQAGRNVAGFVAAIKPLAVYFAVAREAISRLLPIIGAALVRAFNLAVASARAFVTPILAVGRVVGDVVHIVSALLRGDWKSAWQGAKNLVRDVWNGIRDTVVNFGKMVKAYFAAVWGTLLDITKAQLQAIWDFVKAIFGKLPDPVRNAMSKVVDLVRGAISGAKSAAKTIGNVVVDGIGAAKSVVGDVADFLREIPARLKAAAGSIASAAASLGSKLVSGFMHALGGIGSAIINAFRAPINTVIGWWNALTLRIDPGSINVNGPGPVPDIHMDIPGVTLSTPDIPKLAMGGMLDGPTLALVGEAGREYVIPVENNRDRGRELLMQAAGELGVRFLARGAAPRRGKGGGKGGKGGKTHTEIDTTDVDESSSELNKLLALHAAALRDTTGLSALWAPHHPAWATGDKYTAPDGTYDDLETAWDLLRYWNQQVAEFQTPQKVKIGEKWKTYKKSKYRSKGRGDKQRWWDGKKWVKSKTPFEKKGDEIPGTRHPVWWRGILWDQLENAYSESAGWSDFINGLFSAIDETTGGGGTSLEALQQTVDAASSLNQALLRELAIRNAQGPSMNFLGNFDKGGVVPGPVGKPGAAIVHGGETVIPVGGGAGGLTVQIIGDPSLPSLIDRVEVVADRSVGKAGRRAGIGMQTAGATGVRARMRTSRRPNGRG